jgi:predicted transcriptional regulator
MARKTTHSLSRRERQIMDAIFRLGEATAAQIKGNIPSPPTYAAVRRLIAILEEKGFVTHRTEGQRYVYRPVENIDSARKDALAHLKETFFRGSSFKAVSAMLDLSAGDLTEDELRELSEMIEKAKGAE